MGLGLAEAVPIRLCLWTSRVWTRGYLGAAWTGSAGHCSLKVRNPMMTTAEVACVSMSTPYRRRAGSRCLPGMAFQSRWSRRG